MPEPKKRIIVDGVDFWEVFQFPKIMTAAASALQPPRLIIGLLMVVALITIGRAWDAWSTPTVHPSGLEFGLASDGDLKASQNMLRDAVRGYAPDRAPTPAAGGAETVWPDLDAQTVLGWMRRGYADRMSRLESAEAREIEKSQFLAQYEMIDTTRPRGAFEAVEEYAAACFNRMIRGVLSIEPIMVRDGAADLLVGLPREAWNHQRNFTIVYGIAFLIIFSLGGGALSRMAACQFAGQERLRIREAIDFALGNAQRLVFAQTLPLIIVVIVSLVIVLLGAVMAVPVLDVIASVLYGLVLLLGFLLAFLLIGYVLGSAMLVPAVACENCDGPDAMQRSFAYVISRPVHLVFYWVVALIGLAVGFLVVSLIAVAMLNLTAALFGTLTANPAMTATGGYEVFDLHHKTTAAAVTSWHSRWSAAAISFWQTLIICIVAGYVFAYHFSASTIVYLLMRRAADGQDAEEIWRPGLVPGTQTPVPKETA